MDHWTYRSQHKHLFQPANTIQGFSNRRNCGCRLNLYREIKIFCDESKLKEWMDFPCPGNKDFLAMNRFELSKVQELVVIQVCTIHLLDQLHTAKQKQQYTYISRTIIFTKVHLQFTVHLELTNPSTVTYADNCG